MWRVLPPRMWRGAASITVTVSPASAALMAALMPALPPPATSTSMGSDVGSGWLMGGIVKDAEHSINGLCRWYITGMRDGRPLYLS